MFGVKNQRNESKMDKSSNSTTLIAKGAKLTGDFQFTGSLEVHGSINGKVSAKGDNNAQIRILNGGAIFGEIFVPTVIVNGYIKGDIFASANVKLASKAIVHGKIHYNSLEIASGAKVSASLVHEISENNVSDLKQSQKAIDKD
jgi:cytoskeletal protein CcmA (bactofilin family)